MGHMGNSGKTAIGAFAAAAGLLVLTAMTLEEAVLVAFLGAVAVGYVASVAEAFARRRYLALLAGGAGTSLFVGCSIAFLRMWGLAFNEDAASLGQAVTSRDSDIYFYLAAASAALTLLVLFSAAVWPSRRRRQQERGGASGAVRPSAAARPNGKASSRSGGTAKPGSPVPARAARKPAAASARAAQAPAQAPARPAVRLPAGARQPAQRTPAPRTPAQRSDARTPRR
jgi:hypothetical protein